MEYADGKVKDLQIAYIGGGSRGWAWTFMTDLAMDEELSGTIRLYDIDAEAAKHNEIIGNRLSAREDVVGKWNYTVSDSLQSALTGADFIVISILPGTFDEMAVDVHMPERLGIYQSVGDTAGPGGAMRAVKTLYYVFPEIKAFGCCHEVFGTQKVLKGILEETMGLKNVKREDIQVNVLGINHFTWFDYASYKGIDLFPIYRKYTEEHKEDGYKEADKNWANSTFECAHIVKFDLFRKYGLIAAAGDRHLVEFMPGVGDSYLKDPETVKRWKFGLTTVDWRKKDLQERLAKSARLAAGEEEIELKPTGEEGIQLIKALCGLTRKISNVNIPNTGHQIANLPESAVVETNAVFERDAIRPLYAGELPEQIKELVDPHVANHERILKAAILCDFDLVVEAFLEDPQVKGRASREQVEELVRDMLRSTAKYLPEGWKKYL